MDYLEHIDRLVKDLNDTADQISALRDKPPAGKAYLSKLAVEVRRGANRLRRNIRAREASWNEYYEQVESIMPGSEDLEISESHE